MLVGLGYDVHRFGEGRRLVLGGAEIPFPRGLVGHSDADVLAHAVMDALLGAVGEGDIGRHFPDSDPAFENVSSVELLRRVRSLVCDRKMRLVNLDVVVLAEEPRIGPFVEEIRRNLAEALCTDGRRVNVKATTSEGLGFIGRGEGIACYAVASLAEA